MSLVMRKNKSQVMAHHSVKTATRKRGQKSGAQQQAVKLKLSDITCENEVQARVRLNRQVVKEYAQHLKEGGELPPIDVFENGHTKWVADGFHRVAAEQQRGGESILCILHSGDKLEASWFALQANRKHGLRMTNQDKQRAAKQALQHPKGAELSNRSIAEHVGASHTMVAKYRAELERDGKICQSNKRMGQDGRVIETTKIGEGAGEAEIAEDAAAGQERIAAAEATAEEQMPAAEVETLVGNQGSITDSEESDKATDDGGDSCEPEAEHSKVELRKQFQAYHDDVMSAINSKPSARGKALTNVINGHASAFRNAVKELALEHGAKLSKGPSAKAEKIEPGKLALALMEMLVKHFKEKTTVDLFAPTGCQKD